MHDGALGGGPGTIPDPFVSLAGAASVTERIRLGTCVLNAGTWEPLAVGAGHTPQEWIAQGRPFPPAGERVDPMMELVEATQALVAGGAPVFFRGTHFTLVDAVVTNPRPLQDRIPLMVGGNGRRVLRYAAQRAAIVGVTGLGRTLDDGHRHEVDWSTSTIEQIFDQVRSAATEAGREPALEALVQHVEVTDDAAAAAARLAPPMRQAPRCQTC